MDGSCLTLRGLACIYVWWYLVDREFLRTRTIRLFTSNRSIAIASRGVDTEISDCVKKFEKTRVNGERDCDSTVGKRFGSQLAMSLVRDVTETVTIWCQRSHFGFYLCSRKAALTAMGGNKFSMSGRIFLVNFDSVTCDFLSPVLLNTAHSDTLQKFKSLRKILHRVLASTDHVDPENARTRISGHPSIR